MKGYFILLTHGSCLSCLTNSGSDPWIVFFAYRDLLVFA